MGTRAKQLAKGGEKKSRVLLVEDNQELKEAVFYELSLRGFDIVGAGDGEQALAKMDSVPVDVVVSDIRMPNMTGDELLRVLRDRQVSKPPVILISGYHDKSPEFVYAHGVFQVFSKPFDWKKLIACIDSAASLGDREWENQVLKEVMPTLALSGRGLVAGVAKSIQDIVLGRGGIFVPLTDHFPELNRFYQIQMVLQNPEPHTLEFTGEPVWFREESSDQLPAGCGIRFVGMNAASEARINAILTTGPKPRAFIPLGRLG